MISLRPIVVTVELLHLILSVARLILQMVFVAGVDVLTLLELLGHLVPLRADRLVIFSLLQCAEDVVHIEAAVATLRFALSKLTFFSVLHICRV